MPDYNISQPLIDLGIPQASVSATGQPVSFLLPEFLALTSIDIAIGTSLVAASAGAEFSQRAMEGAVSPSISMGLGGGGASGPPTPTTGQIWPVGTR